MELLQPDRIYHIYNHANGNENLFRSNANYNFFLKRYAYFIYPIAETFGYCLMPNHFHFLVKIRCEADLRTHFGNKKAAIVDNILTFPKSTLEKLISKQFSNLFSSYTQSINKSIDRRGSLFIKNFRRKPVDSIEYFSTLIQYIHQNPVHHGFCENMEDWNWTSYHSFLFKDKSIVDTNKVVKYFGSKSNFIAAHQNNIIDYKLLDVDDFY